MQANLARSRTVEEEKRENCSWSCDGPRAVDSDHTPVTIISLALYVTKQLALASTRSEFWGRQIYQPISVLHSLRSHSACTLYEELQHGRTTSKWKIVNSKTVISTAPSTIHVKW